MKKFNAENFSFTLEVIEEQYCRNGHEVGDTYTCEYGCPMPCGNEGGFCSKAMTKVYALCEVVRCGGDLRTVGGKTKHCCEFSCPDGAVKFRLTAHDLAAIQPLTTEQLPQYADVIRRSFATVAKDFGWTQQNAPAFTAFISDECLANKVKKDYHPFGLQVGNKIIGFVSLTHLGAGTYELNHLAILPEYRHFGYGKRLLDFCKTLVRQHGGNKITLGIVAENTVLKHWYAANGFIPTGTRRFEQLPFAVGFMAWEANENG